MTVLIERRNDDTDELEPMARIDAGRIVTGKAAMQDLLVDGDVPSEEELLTRFRGPTLFASRVKPAQAALSSTMEKVAPIPSDVDHLTKDALARWVAWVRAGKPKDDDPAQARKFNPELHPRGPDGKFVERPWDVPDDLDVDSIRAMPTVDLLDELNQAGEPIDDVLADSDIQIDGIPNDVNSVSEAKEKLGGDGLVFQDLEAGDQVDIVQPNGQKTVGQIQKTEQVDGAPNRAHVATNHGSMHVVDVPEGSTIKRQKGPVIPPTDVQGQDPLPAEDIHTGDQVSVVSGLDQGDPTHADTGTVESVGTIGDQKSIQVNGNEYAPNHSNIQTYDASPDELSFDQVSEGDTVAAWTGASDQKVAEGEVVDKTTAGQNQYVTVQDPEKGETQVNVGTQTLTTADAVAEDDAVDAAKDAQDSIDPDDVDPSTVNYADIPGVDTSTVDSADDWTSLEKGDWVAVHQSHGDPMVGRLAESPDEGVALTDIQTSAGPGTKTTTFEGAPKVETISDQGVKQAAKKGQLDMDGPDVSHIDPETVSASAIPSDKTKAVDAMDLQKGDWVVYLESGGDPNAGKVTQPKPGGATLDTGYYKSVDVQEDDLVDGFKQVEPATVRDVGDPAGTDTPKTSTPDSPDSDLNVDDLQNNPNTGDIHEDDLNAPATAEGQSAVGMLDEDQVQAFYELLKDEDQGGVNPLDPVKSRETKYADMETPQANPYKLKDHVAHFANDVDGIPVQNGNAKTVDLVSKVDSWKGKSYTDTGQAIEKAFHAALDLPGDYRNDGLSGEPADDGDAAVAALMTAATQEFFRENWDAIEQKDFWGTESGDDEIPLYRGVGKNAVASLARDWAEQPDADQFTVRESKITNFSNDAELADSWGEKGHVIKKNATADDVVFSPDLMTGDITGIANEGEIWVTGGVSGANPEDIQVESGSDGDTMTMADMNVPPSDMDKQQLSIVATWAKAMNKREYNLDNETQIQTFEAALEEMESGDRFFPSHEKKALEKVIDRSSVALETQPAGQQAAGD